MKPTLCFIINLFVVLTSINGLCQERGFVTDNNIALQTMRSEARVALVIGNAEYKASPLKNSTNDAKLMARILRSKNFDVVDGYNLSLKEMNSLLREFKTRLGKNGVGLVYFAGHGMQISGINYLIPIGADIRQELDVATEALNLDVVLRYLNAGGNRLNIVILDACRNNPFTRSFRSGHQRGLAFVNAARGTIIAFATAPGSVAMDGEGRNGVYTEALARNIRAPGKEIEDIFKATRFEVRTKTHGTQIPWESSSLEGDFIFTLPEGNDDKAFNSLVVPSSNLSGQSRSILPQPKPRNEPKVSKEYKKRMTDRYNDSNVSYWDWTTAIMASVSLSTGVALFLYNNHFSEQNKEVVNLADREKLEKAFQLRRDVGTSLITVGISLGVLSTILFIEF